MNTIIAAITAEIDQVELRLEQLRDLRDRALALDGQPESSDLEEPQSEPEPAPEPEPVGRAALKPRKRSTKRVGGKLGAVAPR